MTRAFPLSLGRGLGWGVNFNSKGNKRLRLPLFSSEAREIVFGLFDIDKSGDKKLVVLSTNKNYTYPFLQQAEQLE